MPPSNIKRGSDLVNAIRQGVLPLLGGKAEAYDKGIEGVLPLLTKGPRGEYYIEPKLTPVDQQSRWAYLRRMLDEGIIKPSDDIDISNTPIGKVAKAQSAAKLATVVKTTGLPRKGSFLDPQFDALALKLDNTGVAADAVAAIGSPLSMMDPRTMYLYDLAASIRAPGSGEHLLKSVLSGPLYPEADKMLFTPLPGARNFYTNKFGMEYLSPGEMLTEPRLLEGIDALGMKHNAEDLGIGIIRRAEGGPVDKPPYWSILGRSPDAQAAAVKYGDEVNSQFLMNARKSPLRQYREEMDTQQSLPGAKPKAYAGGGLVDTALALPKAFAAKREAEQHTDRKPGWSTNGYGDAARHAIAAGLLARRTSPEVAENYGALNETVYPFLTRLALSPDDPRETGMDAENEKFAREMAPHFPSDDAFVQYILNWPEQRKPQSTPGTLQWFGRSK